MFAGCGRARPTHAARQAACRPRLAVRRITQAAMQPTLCRAHGAGVPCSPRRQRSGTAPPLALAEAPSAPLAHAASGGGLPARAVPPAPVPLLSILLAPAAAGPAAAANGSAASLPAAGPAAGEPAVMPADELSTLLRAACEMAAELIPAAAAVGAAPPAGVAGDAPATAAASGAPDGPGAALTSDVAAPGVHPAPAGSPLPLSPALARARSVTQELAADERRRLLRRQLEPRFFLAVGAGALGAARLLLRALRAACGARLAELRDDFLQRSVLHVLVSRHYYV